MCVLPFRIDLGFEAFWGHGPNQNLYARFVFVVSAAVAVIDAHQRFGIGQQVLAGSFSRINAPNTSAG